MSASGNGSQARTRKLQAILGEGMQTAGTAQRALKTCCSELYYGKARDLWTNMPADWKSAESYGSMIQMCKRLLRLREAEELYKELQKASLKPSLATQIQMLDIYKTWGQPDNAVRLFEEMCIPAGGVLILKPNELADVQAVYAAVMRAVAKAGHYAKVRELFTTMTGADWSVDAPPADERSIPPLHPHFHALLVSCAATGDMKNTEAIFNAMSNWGKSPSMEDYNLLMECCRHDLPRCTRIITEMRRKGMRPSGRTYSASFAAMGQAPCSRRWRGADFRGPVTAEETLGRREMLEQQRQADFRIALNMSDADAASQEECASGEAPQQVAQSSARVDTHE